MPAQFSAAHLLLDQRHHSQPVRDVFALNLLMPLSLFALNPTKGGHCYSSLSLQTEHLYTFQNIGTVESSITTRQVNSQFLKKIAIKPSIYRNLKSYFYSQKYGENSLFLPFLFLKRLHFFSIIRSILGNEKPNMQ